MKNNPRSNQEIIKKAELNNTLPFFNAHTHIFNFNYVNNHFLKGMIPWWVTGILTLVFFGIILGLIFVIKSIFNYGHCNFHSDYLLLIQIFISFIIVGTAIVILLAPIYFLLYISYLQPKLDWLIRRPYFRAFLKYISYIVPKSFDTLERYTHLVLHSYDIEKNIVKSQHEIFNELQSYYPSKTKFVTHSMDLDYMVNCNKPPSKSRYYEQLEELKNLGNKTDRIFPTIHIDPRRLADKTQNYLEIVKKYIEDGIFVGFKIYPAVGYFPFDIRLKPIYDLALKYELPITTHCSIGPVYYRGSLSTLENECYYENGTFIHPFTGNKLQGKNGKQFSPHFTHPLNYYCLMHEHKDLYKYWKKCEAIMGDNLINITNYTIEDLKKYRNLKFCLGHYGGASEWKKYLEDPWLPSQKSSLTINNKLLHLPNGKWVHSLPGVGIKKLKPNSWHSIITDMITKNDNSGNSSFPYLYSDISYNLSNIEMLPLLKVRLETNEYLSKKILFGTDFFMVSTVAAERKITMTVRSFIGENNFKKIARINPANFLNSKLINAHDLVKP